MDFKTVELEDGKKAIVTDDTGNPLVVKSDGTEFGIDAIGLYSKVPELQAEAKKYRKKGNEIKAQLEGQVTVLQEKLAVFDGIEDPDSAKQAIETVTNLKDGDLVKAGEVANLKRQMTETFDADKAKLQKTFNKELKQLQESNAALVTSRDQTVLSSNFAKSKLIREKLSIPVDIAETYFGKNFKIEIVDNKPTPIGYVGEDKIYSKANPGSVASFDEALSHILDNYHDKDAIMKTNPGTTTTTHSTQRNTQTQDMPKKGVDRIRAGLKDDYNM